MSQVQNPFAAAAKAGLESQLAFFNALTSATMHSMEKLATLNITAARASVEEFSGFMQQVLGAKTPQELSALLASQAKPTLDKVVAYGGHVSSIAAGAQAELTRVTEARVSEAGRTANQFLGEGSANIPASVPDMMNMIRARFYSAAVTPASEPVGTVVAASVAPEAPPADAGKAAG